MQTVPNAPASPARAEKTAERTVLRPPAACVQHRIYVWSAPSPYAIVIDEERSFLTR